MAERRLEIVVGEVAWRSDRAGVEASRTVSGDVPLQVSVYGLSPDSSLSLQVGRDELPLVADEDGVALWWSPTWLAAIAGKVHVQVFGATDLDGRPYSESFDFWVTPTKLTAASLASLLADLDVVATGLGADLGGQAQSLRQASLTPEHLLKRIDRLTGLVAEASAWLRRRPLGRQRERVAAVPTSQPRLRARDAMWLVHHPAAAMRAGCSGREVGVTRERRLDLDVPENRSALGCFALIGDKIQGIEEALRVESERLRQSLDVHTRAYGDAAPWRVQDEGRLEAVRRRQKRVAEIQADLQAARARTGLPSNLPTAPPLRTASSEAHPGYWGLYRAASELQNLSLEPQPPVFSPTPNLDQLYETWCGLQLALALAEVCGRPLLETLRLDRDGWFVELGHDYFAEVISGDLAFRLRREPDYAYRSTDPVVKLHPGRPWRPDFVLEVRSSGWPIALHVFDAKHRVDRSSSDGAPWNALREIWWKYGESIGWRQGGGPAVSSVWVVHPTVRGDGLRLVGPTMLEKDWPEDRLRGGCLGLLPGEAAGAQSLRRLLRVLLAL